MTGHRQSADAPASRNRREPDPDGSNASATVPRGQMLPGVAGIAMFLLLVTLLNVFAVLRGVAGAGAAKYGVLGLCTLLLLGIYGLLRMRRWGYSIVMAGCLLLSAVYFYFFSRTHVPFLLVQGFFALVFFLYLVRPEVRDRML